MQKSYEQHMQNNIIFLKTKYKYRQLITQQK